MANRQAQVWVNLNLISTYSLLLEPESNYLVQKYAFEEFTVNSKWQKRFKNGGYWSTFEMV